MKETMAMRAPLLERLEELLDRGGTKKDVALLAVSAVALGFSFFAPETLPFNPAWIAIVLCGAPIILGAVIGLVTEFDIKATCSYRSRSSRRWPSARTSPPAR